MTAPLRTFICLELSSELHRKLDRASTQLRTASPPGSVNWVKTDNLHLTLKFLGETPPTAITRLSEALTRVAQETQKFSFRLEGLGCFPNLKQPRVIWVGLQDTPALLALQKKVEQFIAPLGYPAEARPFAPHLTLGRVRREAAPAEAAAVGEAVRQQAQQSVGLASISQIILMKSEVQQGGSIYTPLAIKDLC